MRKLWLILCLSLSLLGETQVKIATYNVENLFDLNYDGSEYSEYIPNTHWQWNAKTYRAKLKNLAKVLSDINADIVALTEIESDIALRDLQKELNRQGVYYPHRAIADRKRSSVKNALLSKYPLQSKELVVSRDFKTRNILEATINIHGTQLKVFVNHWKSKAGPESERIAYAKVLKKRLDELPKGSFFVLCGDFNSHYAEHQTFVKKRKHNNTEGITGINHILGTIDNNGQLYTRTSLKADGLYNLWMELGEKERWSHIYRGKKEALDHIILSPTLLQNKEMTYVEGSFKAFKADYLFSKNKKYLYRWQRSRTKPPFHVGKGYSDHLPLTAELLIR